MSALFAVLVFAAALPGGGDSVEPQGTDGWPLLRTFGTDVRREPVGETKPIDRSGSTKFVTEDDLRIDPKLDEGFDDGSALADYPLTYVDEQSGEAWTQPPRSQPSSSSWWTPHPSQEAYRSQDDFPANMYGVSAPETITEGNSIPAAWAPRLFSGEASRFADAEPPRHTVRRTSADDVWRFVLLPDTLIYRSYLAGPKESRLSTQIVNDDDDLNPNTFLWEATLGSRVGLLRYGSVDGLYPQGWQLDVEGSAQVRLDILEDVDVRSVDFRGGIPLTYGFGRWQAKAAYYHLSSHLGDEFVLKNPGFNRINYARDVFVFGLAYNVFDDLRIYGELGYAFYRKISEPGEVQFGVDYAPARPTGIYGAPFAAANVHLRESVDWSGHFALQAGWAWRSEQSRRLLRVGVHYFNGLSAQYSFYERHEQQIGVIFAYDF